MAIFHLFNNELRALAETSFSAEGVTERRDLQKILCSQIDVLEDRLMVVSEEFSGWADASRRIDILCIDSEANLVVVELKRNEDGGHMDLQALRYAAMVSSMTFEQLVDTYAKYRNRAEPNFETAQQDILKFLDWDEIDEAQFAQDTRIILASAEFGKELTTTVMWLIERGLDIRCIRIKPYRMSDQALLLDVQQIIPLPEAEKFQTQIGVKKQAELRNRSDRQEILLRFWSELLERAKKTSSLHAGREPTTDHWLSASAGRTGFNLNYVIRKLDSNVELSIWMGSGKISHNKLAFKVLEGQKDEIEQEFGAELDWQEMPNKDSSKIRFAIDGGYKSPIGQWATIQDNLVAAMKRLDNVMRRRVEKINLQNVQ